MEIKPFSTKILKSDSTSEDFVQDYVANTTKLIPDIFKKLYPNLTHKVNNLINNLEIFRIKIK